LTIVLQFSRLSAVPVGRSIYAEAWQQIAATEIGAEESEPKKYIAAGTPAILARTAEQASSDKLTRE
jgi:hypothetical protein